MREKDATEPNRDGSDPLGDEQDATSELARETDREILELLAERSPLHVMDIATTTDRHPITVDQPVRGSTNGEMFSYRVEDAIRSLRTESDGSERDVTHNSERRSRSRRPLVAA